MQMIMDLESTSSLHEVALQRIIENRERVLNGGWNSIPFSFPRLNNYIPGIEQGQYVLITASSGVGKSKFTKKAYVFDPLDFVINNPSSNIDLKIFYFCLEESKIAFMNSLYSYKLHEMMNIRRSPKELMSRSSTAIEQDVIEFIANQTEYWEKFDSMVDVVDNIKHPTGIFKYVENWLLANGEWTKKKQVDPATGNERYVNDFYVPNHQDRYVIVIVDHISLINTEKDHASGKHLSLHESITKLSSEYMIQLRDRYNCTPVVVQQQAADTEKQQYTYKGSSIWEKLEPSLSGLGDNKLTQRDVNLAIGLFAPARYGLDLYRDYRLNQQFDIFRGLQVLKNRDGMANLRTSLFFDGRSGVFEEMPAARDMTTVHYSEYQQRVAEDFQQNTENGTQTFDFGGVGNGEDE